MSARWRNRVKRPSSRQMILMLVLFCVGAMLVEVNRLASQTTVVPNTSQTNAWMPSHSETIPGAPPTGNDVNVKSLQTIPAATETKLQSTTQSRDKQKGYVRTITEDSQPHKAAAETGNVTWSIVSPSLTRLGSSNVQRDDLTVLIAKTISFGDIQDTVLDIDQLSRRDANIKVLFKIFCHERETSDKLRTKLGNSTLQSTTVQIHLEEKSYKTRFWKKHLSPVDIPPEVKYVWLVDGDVPLRFMEWSCFWKLVDETYKPAMFEPAIFTSSPYEDQNLYYAGKAHYQKCHAKSSGGNFQRLQAVETHIVDIQTPGFRRDAWELIYASFDRELPGWGDFPTDYGPDFVWCKMVQEEMLKKQAQQVAPGDWTKVQQSCHVPNATTVFDAAIVDPPIACLILHETPLYHRDTKSLTAQRDPASRKLWHAQVDADLKRYRETFSSYALTLQNDRNYFRSFLRPPDEKPCQTCRTFKSMKAAKMV